MNTILKGAAIAALATMGFSLSACGSETANANVDEAPNAADLTAAALDQEAAANVAAAPSEAPSGEPSTEPSASAH